MEANRSYLEALYRPVRRLISPTGITVIDAEKNVLGQLIYQMDSDVGLPVVYDGRVKEFYEHWKQPMDQIKCRELLPSGYWNITYLCTSEKGDEPKEPCFLLDCACNAPYVGIIPYALAQSRGELASVGEYWVPAEKTTMDRIFDDKFTPRGLSFQDISISKMEDPAKQWKDSWICNSIRCNSFFPPKCSGIFNGVNGGTWEQRVSLLDLPLEVYEVLLEYMDGTSLINLSNTSPDIEKRVLEPFDYMHHKKTVPNWYNYCSKDLNRSTVLKIWSSFYTKVQQTRENPTVEDTIGDPTWEQIFKSYKNYWRMMVNGNIGVESLDKFESKLKGEVLVLPKQMDTALGNKLNSKPKRITGTGGGRMLYNVMFPPTVDGHAFNMVVVEDYKKVDCRHVADVCKKATSTTFLKARVVLFPDPISECPEEIPVKPSSVNKVFVGVCDKCITTTPLQGGLTRKFALRQVHCMQQYPMEPIMEVQDNTIALWLHPGYLIVFLVIPNIREAQKAYDIYILYRLQAPQMHSIWDTVAQHQSDFLPIIREYKGDTDILSVDSRRLLMGESSYIFPPTEPTYYGLALVSPIYGIECIKPNESFLPNGYSTVVESISPQHYLISGRKYLPSFRQWSCSGKGHGLFVFCTDKALVVSWDGVEWIFGPIELPNGVGRNNEIRNIIHVDVIYDNGLLLVVNDNILLIELTFLTQPPAIFGGHNMAEPKIKMKTVRVFSLKLAPLLMELTHVELNFDEGKPFLFIIAEKKVKEVVTEAMGGEEIWKWIWDDLSFQIKRIEFY